MLRDRLVVGVNHEHIQEKLLAKKDLTFKSERDKESENSAKQNDCEAGTSEQGSTKV